MIYPSADSIEEKIGSRYSLVVLAAKRAKQIKEGAPVLIDTESTNPLTIALEEIAAGKVTISEAEIVPTPAPRERAATRHLPAAISNGFYDSSIASPENTADEDSDVEEDLNDDEEDSDEDNAVNDNDDSTAE